MASVIPDALRWWTRACPDRVALDIEGEAVTYARPGGLDRCGGRFPGREHGVRPGRSSASRGPTRWTGASPPSGALKAGAIVTPINFRYTASEVEHLVADCSPVVVLADDAQAVKLAEVAARGHVLMVAPLDRLRALDGDGRRRSTPRWHRRTRPCSPTRAAPRANRRVSSTRTRRSSPRCSSSSSRTRRRPEEVHAPVPPAVQRGRDHPRAHAHDVASARRSWSCATSSRPGPSSSRRAPLQPHERRAGHLRAHRRSTRLRPVTTSRISRSRWSVAPGCRTRCSPPSTARAWRCGTCTAMTEVGGCGTRAPARRRPPLARALRRRLDLYRGEDRAARRHGLRPGGAGRDRHAGPRDDGPLLEQPRGDGRDASSTAGCAPATSA